LAVLQIRAPAAKLSPVLIGESQGLLVGQAVFAIGNPFGLNQTLTMGIVSAKSRTIEGPGGRAIEDVIQIDADINPGNSGGPLLDSAGRLVGVNTAIYSRSGTSAGVGFAIPVDTVNRVVPQIIANGRYAPPQMGIRINNELSAAVTARLGVKGVMILEVVKGGGADLAGLQGAIIGRTDRQRLGDIIQKVGDRRIETMNDLLGSLETYQPGDSVTVEYVRNGTTQTTTVTLQ
jgi:S1-C subfamily serine protease